MDVTQAQIVIRFWRDAGRTHWFRGGPAFDDDCRTRFQELHFAAARRECEHWLESADGTLALVLLLDQMSRNIFRGSGHAFATDGLAREYAELAMTAGHDEQVDAALRFFFYMPLEHSEALADQDRSIAVFTALGEPELLKYAHAHRNVIVQFGRYPHRNAALGRTNTPEERAWLDAGGGF